MAYRINVELRRIIRIASAVCAVIGAAEREPRTVVHQRNGTCRCAGRLKRLPIKERCTAVQCEHRIRRCAVRVKDHLVEPCDAARRVRTLDCQLIPRAAHRSRRNAAAYGRFFHVDLIVVRYGTLTAEDIARNVYGTEVDRVIRGCARGHAARDMRHVAASHVDRVLRRIADGLTTHNIRCRAARDIDGIARRLAARRGGVAAVDIRDRAAVQVHRVVLAVKSIRMPCRGGTGRRPAAVGVRSRAARDGQRIVLRRVAALGAPCPRIIRICQSGDIGVLELIVVQVDLRCAGSRMRVGINEVFVLVRLGYKGSVRRVADDVEARPIRQKRTRARRRSDCLKRCPVINIGGACSKSEHCIGRIRCAVEVKLHLLEHCDIARSVVSLDRQRVARTDHISAAEDAVDRGIAFQIDLVVVRCGCTRATHDKSRNNSPRAKRNLVARGCAARGDRARDIRHAAARDIHLVRRCTARRLRADDVRCRATFDVDRVVRRRARRCRRIAAVDGARYAAAGEGNLVVIAVVLVRLRRTRTDQRNVRIPAVGICIAAVHGDVVLARRVGNLRNTAVDTARIERRCHRSVLLTILIALGDDALIPVAVVLRVDVELRRITGIAYALCAVIADERNSRRILHQNEPAYLLRIRHLECAPVKRGCVREAQHRIGRGCRCKIKFCLLEARDIAGSVRALHRQRIARTARRADGNDTANCGAFHVDLIVARRRA